MFQKDYKYNGDHSGMKGYSGMYVVKKFGGQEFANALHEAAIKVEGYPGALIDVQFDENDDLDRKRYLVKVVNGKQVVIATLPPMHPIQ